MAGLLELTLSGSARNRNYTEFTTLYRVFEMALDSDD